MTDVLLYNSDKQKMVKQTGDHTKESIKEENILFKCKNCTEKSKLSDRKIDYQKHAHSNLIPANLRLIGIVNQKEEDIHLLEKNRMEKPLYCSNECRAADQL